jgi:hypothetical protein
MRITANGWGGGRGRVGGAGFSSKKSLAFFYILLQSYGYFFIKLIFLTFRVYCFQLYPVASSLVLYHTCICEAGWKHVFFRSELICQVLSAPRTGEDKLAMMAISKEILVKLLPAVASQDLLQVFVASFPTM